MGNTATIETDTGTKLTLDNDRDWEAAPNDSVMRVVGKSSAGSQVLNAAFTQVSEDEAELVATLLDQIVNPDRGTIEQITNDIAAAFPASLSGSQAHRAAEIAAQSLWAAAAQKCGLGDQPEVKRVVQEMTSRFERTASKARSSLGGNGDGGKVGSYAR